MCQEKISLQASGQALALAGIPRDLIERRADLRLDGLRKLLEPANEPAREKELQP